MSIPRSIFFFWLDASALLALIVVIGMSLVLATTGEGPVMRRRRRRS